MRQKKRILYVFDDINYKNGVQKVTALQVSALKEIYDITLFSLTRPHEYTRALFSQLPVAGESVWDLMQVFSCPIKKVLSRGEYGIKQKLIRILYALLLRIGLHNALIDFLVSKQLYVMMNTFDIVIVLSESSKMRRLVANLKKPKKVQWIHTDYGRWHCLNDWTRAVSKFDRSIYSKFDKIITLSNSNRESFLSIFPEFREKTVVVWNMIPVDEIIEKSMQSLSADIKLHPVPRIITISRLDREKALDRLLNVCRRLKEEGYWFHWYLVGGGVLYDNIIGQLKKLRLENTVTLTGELENPMPLLKQCDFMALLSKYEGMPVTVHEAMILGVPVIATNVGGVSEQIQDGINGLLVDNDEEAIYNGLKSSLDNPERLAGFREHLKNYRYDNQHILKQLTALFDSLVGEKDK